MKTGNNWKAFLSGMITMALLCALAVPTLAAGNLTTLTDVMVGGIRIVIDGQELHPVNANGNPVEPMIYKGTTYLPVRAVASALGKAVYWDGPSYTVYLGDMDGQLEYPTVMLKDMTSIGEKAALVNKALTDNYGNRYSTAVYNHSNNTNLEYLIAMKYSRFKGVLYIPEGEDSSSSCNLTIEADGRVIYSSPEMTKSSQPVPLDVDVTGYNNIKIIFSDGCYNLGTLDSSGASGESFSLCLANAGFYQ